MEDSHKLCNPALLSRWSFDSTQLKVVSSRYLQRGLVVRATALIGYTQTSRVTPSVSEPPLAWAQGLHCLFKGLRSVQQCSW